MYIKTNPWHVLQEYYEKVILKFDIISDKRSELVRTLRNGVKKFEDDQMMIDFCKQYRELFNDNEFKLYEYFKDDDSEGETDGDNEDNNHDDDGAPTADANKKKEKLENQAKKKLKKKTSKEKRKTVIEMTPPSFSLGLSPDTNKVEERAAKRVKKPSRFIVSPYINKKTATKGKAVQDEMMICSYLFSMEGSELDFIFETKEGNATIRDYMQTLAPSLKIESNVIDTYCLVLNHEQGVNSKRKKTKHFFHTGMITRDMFNWKMEDGKKYDEKKQYKAFSDTMKNEFKKDNEVKKLKDLEMKNMFSMYLKEVQHPKAKEVLNKKPTILRPKWGTKENNTDCGVFLMMHMENYNGENARN
ncbi:ulp1 protease family, C-terminal catalytic domain-containing protein [Tanacetum coccineum]